MWNLRSVSPASSLSGERSRSEDTRCNESGRPLRRLPLKPRRPDGYCQLQKRDIPPQANGIGLPLPRYPGGLACESLTAGIEIVPRIRVINGRSRSPRCRDQRGRNNPVPTSGQRGPAAETQASAEGGRRALRTWRRPARGPGGRTGPVGGQIRTRLRGARRRPCDEGFLWRRCPVVGISPDFARLAHTRTRSNPPVGLDCSPSQGNRPAAPSVGRALAWQKSPQVRQAQGRTINGNTSHVL